MPGAQASWTHRSFPDGTHAEFSQWRTQIPPDAEVFWWDSPQAVWFLLERRSYLTLSQSAGAVFSRELTMELQRRATVASAFIDPGYWFFLSRGPSDEPLLNAGTLRLLCRDPALGEVVSRYEAQAGAPRLDWPGSGSFIYLYHCRDYR
jgi:hypothetical protein